MILSISSSSKWLSSSDHSLLIFEISFLELDDLQPTLNESDEDDDHLDDEDIDKIKLEVDSTEFNAIQSTFNQETIDPSKETKNPLSDFQCYHCGKIIQTLEKVKEHITEVHKCPPRRYGAPRYGSN